ncbi:MAG: WecB/TagA/CpsF family glycosyltransferase [bacterium]|nr:WecB/TagA/CpsF family glycosyltransferase [bacterium]
MRPENLPHCGILGVRLAVTDYKGVLECVKYAIEQKRQIRLNFCNVHVAMLAQRLVALMAALNDVNAITVPDGMPLVWALRSWGVDIRDRVYGPDFFGLCMEQSRELGLRHFFYGSTWETLTRLREKLQERYGTIDIADMYAPPFRPLTPFEREEVVARINRSGANILWVALGAPRQEVWIDQMAQWLQVPVLAAIGAAFAFYAGMVKQAPDWMQRRGLEWVYRLTQEPRRLWFRYLYYNPLFVCKYVWERLTARRRDIFLERGE